MILNQFRDLASKGYEKDSRCPECQQPLIAKCGEIVVWHWAHKVNSDCPHQGETEWHMGWKLRFPIEWVERKYGERRADVLLPSNEIIEFQRKGLDPQTIAAREFRAFNSISWVFNGTEFNERFELRSGSANTSNYRSFRWKHPTKTWLAITGRFSLDLGNGVLFHVRKIGTEVPLGGFGHLDSRDNWVNDILDMQRLPNGHYPLQKFKDDSDAPPKPRKKYAWKE